MPSPIPAKSPKEVREISKYFKTTNLINNNKNNNKPYAQASNTNNNTREVLKVKKIFLNFQVKKIKNIQKIIRGNGKPKFKLNMTAKGLSSKQIIVSMNNNNKTNFMKNSSNHVTNLNRTLKISNQILWSNSFTKEFKKLLSS